MNILKTIRNNWKKTVFFTSVSAFIANYGYKKWNNYLLMVSYSYEAKKYGEELLQNSMRLKRVIVFLNPAASSGSGKKLYEKNVAPLLHLAGLEVTLVLTEYEGQAKKYMEVIDDADAILVAGGDGTLSEVITGLMRRNNEKLLKIPIGVIPLGKTNTLAKSLCADHSNTIKFIAELTMSTIKGKTKPIDVLNIKGNEDKSVYAANGIEIGLLTDSEIRKKKNWYFGPLKHRLCYIASTYFHWPPKGNASFTYSYNCLGCNKCKPLITEPHWKWWHIFLSPKREVQVDYSNVVNEDCGKIYQVPILYSQLKFTINKSLQDDQDHSIDVNILPQNVSSGEFIKEGWKRLNSNLKSMQISTNPNYKISEFNLVFNNQFDEDTWFLIDNEKYEPMNLTCTLLPNKLNFYHC